jgi:hypothetical protein
MCPNGVPAEVEHDDGAWLIDNASSMPKMGGLMIAETPSCISS